MKTIEYNKKLQWVGTMSCPNCKKITNAWQSSGMSMSYPHFYCNLCSNVIHRFKDQKMLQGSLSQEVLDQIANDLPECPCGGKFQPGANPKCVHCGADFQHQDEPIKRLTDPHMIAIDGACVFSDKNEPYKVKIL